MAADPATMSTISDVIVPAAGTVAAAIAGGVAGALRHGSRIAALEKGLVTRASLQAKLDALKEEVRQIVATALASVHAGISDADVRRIVSEVVVMAVNAALAQPLAEIRSQRFELDRMQRQMADDARYADKKYSEFDRLVGRFERAIETIDRDDR